MNSFGSEIRPGNREAEVQPWCWFGRTAQNWYEYKSGESIKNSPQCPRKYNKAKYGAKTDAKASSVSCGTPTSAKNSIIDGPAIGS